MGAIVQTKDHILGGVLLQKGHVYVTVAFSIAHHKRTEEMEETLYILNSEDSIVEGHMIKDLNGIPFDRQGFDYEVLQFPKKEDRDRLEEEMPGLEYTYLVKDKNNNHYFAGHVGPCDPEPYFYIEDPSDPESVFRSIYLKEDL